MILCQVSFQISGPLWVHSLLHWQHHTGLVCRGPEVCSNGNSESNLGCILIIRLYFKYSTYHTIHIYPYLSISYPTYPASTHPRSQLRRSSGTPARISCKCLLFWSLLCFCFISILYISIYFYFIYFYILYIIFPLFLYISMYFLWWLSSSLNRNLLNYASLDLWIIHNLPTKNTTQIYFNIPYLHTCSIHRVAAVVEGPYSKHSVAMLLPRLAAPANRAKRLVAWCIYFQKMKKSTCNYPGKRPQTVWK